MNCSISKEQLIGYHYQELAKAELLDFEKHLPQCESCQKELAELSQTSQILQAWPAENSDIKMVFMEEKVVRRSQTWDWVGATTGRRWSFAAAAMLAIVMMVFGVLQYDRKFNRSNPVAVETDSKKAPVFSQERSSDPLARIYNDGIPTNAANRQNPFTRRKDDKILRDIEVMANIMDQAFENQFRQFFEIRGKTHGVYVNGLGPVFVVRDGNNNEFHDRDVNRILERLQGYQTTWQFSSPSPNVWAPQPSKENVEDFPTALLEIVGEYGHNLRPFSPSESIVVAVELDKKRIKRPGKSNRFLIKVKKKDIDAYNQGLIKMADFRKLVEVKEY